MADLTEQWKKGELPSGYYYVSDGAEVTIDYYLCDYWERHFDSDVLQVLAPVPSYDDWMATRGTTQFLMDKNKQLKEYEQIVTSYNMKPIDYETACETVNKLLDEKKSLKEENTKLKKLLKDLRDKAGGALQAIQKDCESDDFSIFIYPEVQYFYDLLTKINQTLGGDK